MDFLIINLIQTFYKELTYGVSKEKKPIFKKIKIKILKEFEGPMWAIFLKVPKSLFGGVT